ncbi:Shikimate kinase 1 [Sporotomaculum syntrophicum]|uniref:Shikimate kinase n=1 Tax=Sporotomaculum syntrophicum TaxID=182264 RepID=A0A9D2WT11_9FIRM|nr:shikimate kinase [Sporotomaculum syntrophicum]KAF1086585.1 Shikimate kinase 1 [Sporotomaculum syntrophicum]
MKKNIVLIGFMGVGKSTLGRRLAKRLGYKFIDTDSAIEEITGKTVEQIFRTDGEIRFRSEEKLLARKLAGQTGLVIATGGGMVLEQENVELLKQNGVLICLHADPQVILQRVKNKRRRPLLSKGNLLENIIRLTREREGAYDIAELTLDTGKLTYDEMLQEIKKFLEQKGYLR